MCCVLFVFDRAYLLWGGGGEGKKTRISMWAVRRVDQLFSESHFFLGLGRSFVNTSYGLITEGVGFFPNGLFVRPTR